MNHRRFSYMWSSLPPRSRLRSHLSSGGRRTSWVRYLGPVFYPILARRSLPTATGITSQTACSFALQSRLVFIKPNKRILWKKRYITHIHQTKTRNNLLTLCHPPRSKSPGRTPWIHKKLALMIKGIKPMRTAPTQNIHIQFICFRQQQIWFLTADYREAFQKSYSELSVGYNLGNWCWGRCSRWRGRRGEGGGWGIVATADDFEVGC